MVRFGILAAEAGAHGLAMGDSVAALVSPTMYREYVLLKSHEYIDLLIIMLGTNDTKERLNASAATIGWGMERLVRKAMTVDCWAPGAKPNVLIVSPPPVGKGVETSAVADEMGVVSVEKSEKLAAYYQQKAELLGVHFMDAAAVNSTKWTSCT